jgi:hypothetical protein
MRLENLLQRRAAGIENAEQQMFRADVIILELAGLGLRGIERLLQFLAGKHIAAARARDLVAAREFLFHVRLELGRRHADFLQQFGHEAFALADQCQQQMLAIHRLVRKAVRDALGIPPALPGI